MDQPVALSGAESQPRNRIIPTRWRGGSLAALVEALVLATLLLVLASTYFILSGQRVGDNLLTPPIVAGLLVANLVPAIALLVLLGRRVANRRAALSPIGGEGQLHVRLVAIFSTIASVPMLMVVVFASLLFQYGMEVNGNVRSIIQNAGQLARGYTEQNKADISDETITMAGDIRKLLQETDVQSPLFQQNFILQLIYRKLANSAIVVIGKDGIERRPIIAVPERSPPGEFVPKAVRDMLAAGQPAVVQFHGNRIDAVTLLDAGNGSYLYTSRNTDSGLFAFSQAEAATKVLADYDAFAEKSRTLQLKFNVALYFGTLLLVGLAVWIALLVADWLVRPVGQLVNAARRVTAGDLSARVQGPHARDELGTLSTAFNRMTQRLEAQTSALVSANNQLDSRRAFIEAVLSGVTAGIVSVDKNGTILLLNRSATEILAGGGEEPVGRQLDDVAPGLAELLEGKDGVGIVQINTGGEPRTLAVKIAREQTGHVLTFDDITQQLSDQRRAAWADVARRIAHEIKNPLTPIQLAAERLQRRYGGEIANDAPTFNRLTGTIVRQVGDLRRIVDEFSSFARMPKPVFRREALADIARHSLFLHEVAHPTIRFTFHDDSDGAELVCDRRQLGQALTNVIKNAVEAIEQKSEKASEVQGSIALTLSCQDDGHIVVRITDDGIGLPAERSRIIEPYMTTRAKGTGLGLAIVKKIVEDHLGEIAFTDNPGGGTAVTMIFDPDQLGRLDEDKQPQSPMKEKTDPHGS